MRCAAIMKQQEAKCYGATVVTDKDFNVISVSQSFYEIYGLDPLPLPTSLEKILRAQAAAGWFTLFDAFSGYEILDATMHKVRSNQYFKDFHISPLGEVIDITHCKNPASGDILFNHIPTAMNAALTSEKSYEVRGLLALRDLTMLGVLGIFPLGLELNQPEVQKCAVLICAPKSGRLIILDEAGIFPELVGINSVEDLSLTMQDIAWSLDNTGQYSAQVKLEGSEPLQLALKRQLFYASGPSLLTGKVTRLCRRITTESILNKFPMFSSKEAEVICLLAQGYTTKETAAKIGKAQVTVSLQARSAVLKSNERSINALIARITHSLPQNVEVHAKPQVQM